MPNLTYLRPGPRRILILTVTAVMLFIVCSTFGRWLPATAIQVGEARTEKGASTPAQVSPDGRARLAEAYGKLPMSFEANRGQAGQEVKFLSRGQGYNLLLTSTEAVLDLHKSVTAQEAGTKSAVEGESQKGGRASLEHSIVRMRLRGARTDAQVAGVEEQAGKTNYFIGNEPEKWRKNIPTYAKVRYQEVYKGVDLLYYGNQRQLEYDFIVAPGADPNSITLEFQGIKGRELNRQGDLSLKTEGGDVSLHRPIVYQEVGGERREIASRYVLRGNQAVGFQISEYDESRPLVIDPVLVYSTYLGGNGNDQAFGIAVDSGGNAYLTGQTSSTNFNVVNPAQATNGGFYDVFVTKLDASGSAIIYSTYLGGGDTDIGYRIAVDASGNAYLTGSTWSVNFPTANALHSTPSGGSDAFVAELNSAGSTLLYSTYLGGSSYDTGLDIAVDAVGYVYVTGEADSRDFPVHNALQPIKDGKLLFKSSNGASNWSVSDTGLVASSINHLVVDPSSSSNVYAAADNGIYKSTDGGGSWAAAGKGQTSTPVTHLAIDPSNSSIIYATTTNGIYKSTDAGAHWNAINNGLYFPYAQVLTIDPTNPSTLYTAINFGGGFYKSADGGNLWTRLDTDYYNNFESTSYFYALSVDPNTPANIYLGTDKGLYKSVNGGSAWTFGGTGLPFFSSVYDLAIDRTNPQTIYAAVFGSVYKSVNGGANWSTTMDTQTPMPQIAALAIDPANSSIIYAGTKGGGVLKSTDAGATWNPSNTGLAAFNINTLAISASNSATLYLGSSGGADAFVSKLYPAGSSQIYTTYLGGDGSDFGNAITIDSSGDAYIAGNTSSNNFPTMNALQPAKAETVSYDAFVTKLNPTGSALIFSTFLGGNSFDVARDIALDPSGNIFLTGSTLSSNFPSVGAFQSVKGDQFNYDAFVTKLNSSGNAISYSTYLGGNSEDMAYSIAVDSASNAYVTGSTRSTNFPVLSAAQPTKNDFSYKDAFVTKITSAGSILGYSTYLGGNGDDTGRSIALDSSNNVYVAGIAGSTNFPTVNPMQATYNGSFDAFVTKFSSAPDLVLTMTDSPDPVLYGSNLTYTINISNNGEVPATNVTLDDTLPTGAGLVSMTPSQGSCSGTHTLKCNLGTLNQGGSATVTLVVTPPQVRNITNTASVTASEPESTTANNSSTQSTTVDFTDLMLKNFSALRLTEVGGVDTFVITVKNLGPAVASSVNITNNLPPELTFVSCSATNAGVCGGSGNNRTALIPTLAVGASATATFAATVNAPVAPGTTISDTASVTSAMPDINPTNDAETVTTIVKAASASGPKKNGLIALDSGRGDGTSGTSDIYVINPDGTGASDITSELPGTENTPVWSPDGTKIAYISHSNGTDDGIYVMNADGSNKRQVSSGSYYDQNPTWSPDGTRIAFGSNRTSGSYGIYVIDLDGSNLTRLADGNVPDWSPDGARIVFSTGRGIGMMNADGSGVTIIPVPSPGNGAGFFKWSPDGAKLVLTGYDASNGLAAVFTINADGTNLVKINNTAGAMNPSWSPDGTKIVFTNTATSGYNNSISTINLDGSGLTKVSGDLKEIVSASWQPQPPNWTPLPPSYSISGRITGSTGGGAYAKIHVTGSITRDAQTDIYTGNYIVRGLPAGGNYTVTAEGFGPTTTTPDKLVFNNLNADQTGADFQMTFISQELSGYVKEPNGTPLPGVSIILQNGYPSSSTVTDANGFYKFSTGSQGNAISINYNNQPALLAMYVFDPPFYYLPNSTLSGAFNFTARPRTASIKGQLTVGGIGKSGITVYLGGLESTSVTTDANGNYSFNSLGEGGSYTVSIDQSFYPFSPANRTINNLSGQMTGVDFAAPLNQYLISGTVLNPNTSIPIVDATITLSGASSATTQTDSQGHYSFLLPANGTYTIKPSKTGYTFNPASTTIGNLVSNSNASFSGVLTSVQLSESALSVNESGNSATLTVYRYGTSTGTVTVDYSTSDGTASQRTDYTSVSGTLTFGPNVQSRTIVIPIINDAYVEGTETINVTLSNPTNALIVNPGAAVVSIINDDTAAPAINPIDNASFFVRQHYHDFLNRVPDQGGLDYWTSQIANCGTDANCINSRRVGVSAAYFIETEFQDTGGYVYRFYKATYGARPSYAQFMPDRSRVVGGADLESGKVAFADAWVQRPEFLSKYPASLTGAQFIDALLQTVQQGSGVDLSDQRAALNNDYNTNQSRARVVRMVAENAAFKQAEYNKAFVLMQYFGYLRRDPDDGGYLFWLDVLNNKVPNNYRGMVCAFITSAEYQDRFSSLRTRNDRICSNLAP
ncbi:MAG: hypothetical protein QOD00_3792 [Blastocatellia bacterium]|jgi:uncharacterized repeat protein (TIGR01451 family)|nr:hypothetical protein [Blastocatellia bacterium]